MDQEQAIAVLPSWPPAEFVHTYDPLKAPKNLLKKLAAIFGDMKDVPKNGWNEAFKYSYAKESDVVELIRPAFAAKGLALLPTLLWQRSAVVEYTTERGARRQMGCTCRYQYQITDSESGEMIVLYAEGTGCDPMPGDKAFYKASTGCNKYFVLRLMQISQGDDPERSNGKDEGEQSSGSGSRAAKSKTQTQAGGLGALICTDCKKPITDHDANGKKIPAAKIAEKSKAKFNVELCWPCGVARKEKGKPVDTSEESLGDAKRVMKGQIVKLEHKDMTKNGKKVKDAYRLITLHGGIVLTDFHKSHCEFVNLNTVGSVGEWLVELQNKGGQVYRHVEELRVLNGIKFEKKGDKLVPVGELPLQREPGSDDDIQVPF